MKKLIAIYAMFLVTFFSTLAYVDSTRAASAPVAMKVEKVFDGDTMRLCHVKTPELDVPCVSVRMNNLNTPEKRLCRPTEADLANACERCGAGATLGARATANAVKLLPRGALVLVEVVNRDRYNRVVANITLPDGSDYATRAIADGFGVAYPCKNGRCGARPRPWCPA